MPHIFYETKHLSSTQKEEICRLAESVSTNVKIDKLVCSESFARQRANLTFEEVMEFLNIKSHFVVIHRTPPFGEEFGEIGFSSCVERDLTYFLFIYLSLDKLKEIIEKYNLKVL